MRSFELYYDINARKMRTSTGTQLTDNLPYIRYKERLELTLHLVTDGANPPTAYTGFAGESIAITAALDNDWDHWDTGALVDSALSGTITEIEVSDLSVEPAATGLIQLINSDGDGESVAYTDWTLNGSNYTFTVNATLTYIYAADDEVNISDPPLIAVENAEVDQTDKDTGVFVLTLDGNTVTMRDALEGVPSLQDVFFEIQVRDGSADLILVCQFPFYAYNIMQDDGVIPAPADGNYYTKAEVDALLNYNALNNALIFDE